MRPTVILAVALLGGPALAQPAPTPANPPAPQAPTPTPPADSADDGGLTVRDTSAGYIENAVPVDQIFLRSDAGYRFLRPNRAEFFYPQNRPNGPGLAQNERSVDYNDLTLGAEVTLNPRVSVFAGVPVRFLDPRVNANAAGLGDVWAGFKVVTYRDPATVLSFQLTAVAPSGNAGLGLGTNHATIEPALLAAHTPMDRLTLLGELRAWTPLGGTGFAGEVIRYGFGGRYDVVKTDCLRVAPTLEFVGWEVLGGKQSGLTDAGVPVVESAAGTSILNLKVGCRIDWGTRAGFYVGYGRPITGEKWYSDVVRIEARWVY